MSTPLHLQDELLDLLVKEASEGLGADEHQQLQRLLSAQSPASVLDADMFASSMAALTLVAEADPATHSPAMPAALAARILASAAVAEHSASANKVVSLATARKTTAGSDQTGWWAAAACLVLAVLGWWPRLMQHPAPLQLTATQQREQMLHGGRAIQASWQPGNDPAATALQGDVVFDPASQRGYLRFRGIPANDPRLAQYQLWIADGARTQPQPVDGGVFNVNLPQTTPEGDVIIPFEARLQVGKPAAFVVTIEQPGGVVVSSQEHVLALAPVK